MCEFEEKVKKNLIECGVSLDGLIKDRSGGLQKIGVAVSGGADSISLLLALSSLFSSLYVITVNHNIRPESESRGDVDYVLEVCEKLRRDGHEIICKAVELQRGSVEAESRARGRGIEEAARYLRYEAFDKFVSEYGLSALCLAHNQNDQLETVLMRFLQGASLDSAGGIKERRGCFVRPLLNISRTEIEEYVASRGFEWRTDKTNYETDYLRNRIRLKLVPFLDENFDGWQKAVLNGADKAEQDSQLIQSLISKIPLKEIDGCIEIPLDSFTAAPDSVKYRILLEACNRAGETSRIPHTFLKDVLSAAGTAFTKHFGSIDIVREKNKLFVKKHTENNTDLVFSDIIEKTGKYKFPFGNLTVFNYKEQDGKRLVSVCVGDDAENGNAIVAEVPLPFCLRSISPGDTVLSADGTEKKIADILSDWHVPSEKRELLPVIQILTEKSQGIKAVLGGFLGYKDWIVK